jgi:hypothetical protein
LTRVFEESARWIFGVQAGQQLSSTFGKKEGRRDVSLLDCH